MSITEQIRQIIRDHARLPVEIDSLPDDADLYRAGMTSHASVNVMLAVEDGFDVEFPDAMLTRDVFASVSAIRSALSQLTASTSA